MDKLKEAWENAFSIPPGKRLPAGLEYIGEVRKEGIRFRLYKEKETGKYRYTSERR